MKGDILNAILISILSLFSVYSYADCEERAFIDNYLSSKKSDKCFFIKGVALDVFEYGRTIKVIEDLKGNFVDDSLIFVWGWGDPGPGCMTTERWDIITQYEENDTLIMLIVPVFFENCLEVFGDYTTIACASSVLKLSNGFVTGRIFFPWGNFWNEATISWEEFQELLNSTSIQSLNTSNNIYQRDGTIFFENGGNETIKLTFYDLSGKIIYKTTTTSNSYRPALTGNIFICKIEINDKSYTIKYIVP